MCDTNLITLNTWLLREEHSKLINRVEFANLMSGIALACKITSNAIKRAGFEQLFGLAGVTNVHSEDVKKLDIVANDAFKTALKSTREVFCMVSEEEESIIPVPEHQSGQFVITFDPLDGSSNLDANVSVGSIFAIWPKVSTDSNFSDKDVLRPGRQMYAAGYALYGSATMLVLTLGNGVFGFTLDYTVGEFVLTHADMKIKPRGSIYSINEGNSVFWEKATAEYVNSIKSGSSGRAPYSSRYIGSMVSDVHRTLLYGGIFMYPGDTKSPNGKLRYLYEVAPLSFIVEQAGGKSSDGKQPCLDIVPKTIHQRNPVFMGSSHDVTDLESFHKK
ncbi:D-fructose-1,6-bisphosphate 1-phosphohydrolase [Heterostelium album PN500]|uniref:fructose-bisphosphatase n=1 Tax=Heterostelium pallidum (strain ATCC 26659 / Pp 5 / PN500) TaxID=670386 RepID=D3AXN0_HETP5|nr:D-fructose-1,6-bisphosphate 1-phosphohydrolase [Heterostelium album PN500]EFA85707.1 D-fructose-1,6-bisphosphate 1-phosphohydrolase [Heterostelium album PN500]|eukprot:XP_020437813.1 D-fructose-1,6-bisphosphate 1-phosphohydrolase [Heterostelium album PN500]